jgi:hypothetical protein
MSRSEVPFAEVPHARLEALGLPGVQSRGEWFRMPPEDWEKLLSLAETGKGIRGMGDVLKDAGLL